MKHIINDLKINLNAIPFDHIKNIFLGGSALNELLKQILVKMNYQTLNFQLFDINLIHFIMISFLITIEKIIISLNIIPK